MSEYNNETVLTMEDPAPAPKGENPPETQAPPPHKVGKTAKEPKPPVRRVGTVTMGVVLILGGCTALAALLVPGFNWMLMLKLSPAILIVLGLEVIWFGTRQNEVRVKYDFLSMVVCLLMLGGAVGISLAIPAVDYLRSRELAEAHLEQQLTEQTFEPFQKLGVGGISANFSLFDWPLDPERKLQDLQGREFSHLSVELLDPCQDEAEFAEKCAQITQVLNQKKIAPRWMSISGHGTGTRETFYLTLNGPYGLHLTAEQMQQEVEHYIEETNEQPTDPPLPDVDEAVISEPVLEPAAEPSSQEIAVDAPLG